MRVIILSLPVLMLAPLAHAAAPEAAPDNPGGAVVALFVVVAAVALWIALRAFVRSLRAGKAKAAVGTDFTQYALQALVNAAKIDGRVNEEEKRAIEVVMHEIAGEAYEAKLHVEEAFAKASLNKDELVAYLAARAGAFTRDQKVALLRALMTVFVADGKFDETEHAALVNYTAAVGFDRETAPQTLRGIASAFQRGSIT